MILGVADCISVTTDNRRYRTDVHVRPLPPPRCPLKRGKSVLQSHVYSPPTVPFSVATLSLSLEVIFTSIILVLISHRQCIISLIEISSCLLLPQLYQSHCAFDVFSCISVFQSRSFEPLRNTNLLSKWHCYNAWCCSIFTIIQHCILKMDYKAIYPTC